MKLFRKEEGFTLVELMVVVLIIGILVAIAIPIFNAARANAQEKACLANLRTLNGAAQTYQAENQTLPADLAAFVSGNVVKAVPKCPAQPTVTYTYVAATGTTTCTFAGHVLP